jgi:hypothetical protein
MLLSNCCRATPALVFGIDLDCAVAASFSLRPFKCLSVCMTVGGLAVAHTFVLAVGLLSR